MNVNKDIKPLHLFIGIAICVIVGIGFARLAAPHLLKKQVLDESITIYEPKAPGAKAGIDVNKPPTNRPSTQPAEEDAVCIQVITPAQNPETTEIRDFPTPCDVPVGWKILN